MKKLLATLGIVGGLTLGATTPLPVGEPMQHVVSYETYLYDTPDGELGNGYYALTDSGKYIIQEKAKDEGGVTLYEDYDVSGMTLANKVGKQVYSEYYSKKEDRVHREKLSSEDYAQASTKGYQPKVKREKENLIEIITPKAEAIIVKDLTTSSSCSACSSLTYSHTNAGGGGNVLMAAISGYNTIAANISTVTYNGDSVSSIQSASTGNIQTYLYGRISPDTGSNSLVITASGVHDFLTGSVTTYTGVQELPTAGATATGFGLASAVTCGSTSYIGWLVDAITKYNTTEAITQGSSQTSNSNVSVGAGFGIIGGSSYISTTTGRTFNWTWTSTSRDWAVICTFLLPIETEEQRTSIKSNVNLQGNMRIQ